MPENKRTIYDEQTLVNDDMVSFIDRHEKAVKHMYLDTLGNVTVGRGFMIGNESEAKKYPFKKMIDRNTYGSSASPLEIEDSFKRVKKKPYGQNYGERVFSPFEPEGKDLAKVGLEPEIINVETKKKLSRFENELKGKIPRFDELPYNARKSLMDMQYNMGNNRFVAEKWPSFYKALDKRDYAEMARQSRRKDVHERRNKEIYDMLMELDQNSK
jgi:GH24 family phage-related lysozyme (muramidase)